MIPGLLRERVFRRFWIGQTVSLFGDVVSLFAVPVTAVVLLHAGAGQMGLLTAAGLLPNLVLALHAGLWVDRTGCRRRIMIIADLVRAGLMLAIPVLYALGVLAVWQLYAVAVAAGVCDVFFTVAYQTLFVSTVPRKSYVEGQALLNGSRAFSQVTGQGLAGVVIALLTAPGAVLLDAATFLASAWSLRSIDPDEPPAEPRRRGGLSAGVQFIRGSSIVRSALCATATVNLFTLGFNALFVLFALRRLGLSTVTLGVVLGCGALGAVLGSAVAGRVARRLGRGRAFAVGCLMFPAPLALVPLADPLRSLAPALLLLAEFLSGFGVMILDVTCGAIFAEQIPHRLRARVAGAYRMVNYGVRPIGAALGGLLGARLGLVPTLWICVVGASCCGVWLLGSPLLAPELPPAESEQRLSLGRAARV